MNDLLSNIDIFYKLSFTDKEKHRNYMRDYMKNRYHSVRNKIIQDLGGKCNRCGSKDNLHLDHKDKSKKQLNMADAHSVADSKLKEELKNIQLLCEDCHKQKTREAWDYSTDRPRHGTYWNYRRHKCRCEPCRKAYKEKLKFWRNNKVDKI